MLAPNNKIRVLVLGGYGNFGKRICIALTKEPLLQIIIAGRSESKAKDLKQKILTEQPLADIEVLKLDLHAQDFAEKLKNSQPFLLIHSAGPFQGQDYTVAKTCIDLNIHYLDLADGREFVSNISELDEKAKENKVTIISGASSVPGLSSVIIDTYSQKFSDLKEIEIGIASGNKTERGNATIEAILGYTGKPFQRLERGNWVTVYGWQNLHRHYYGDNLGLRWHGNCDIPDLALFPIRYPKVKTVVFYAGLEVTMMHWLMWMMSWLTRAKIVKNWAYFNKLISKMSNWFSRFGTNKGGMSVRLYGTSLKFQPLEVVWTLIAEEGHGPEIPTLPCIIIAKKMIQGLVPEGARPCLGMFTLEEFDELISQWTIYYTVTETEH